MNNLHLLLGVGFVIESMRGVYTVWVGVIHEGYPPKNHEELTRMYNYELQRCTAIRSRNMRRNRLRLS